MDKKHIEQAAKEHSKNVWGVYSDDLLEDYGVSLKLGDIAETDFTAGVNWLLSVQEEIEATNKNK